MSRPPVFNEVKKEIVCALVAVGTSRRRAAEVIGVDEATIRYHIKTDAAFAQRVAQAEVLLEVEFMVKLRQNAGRSWKACAWALDRLDRQRQESEPSPSPLAEGMADQADWNVSPSATAAAGPDESMTHAGRDFQTHVKSEWDDWDDQDPQLDVRQQQRDPSVLLAAKAAIERLNHHLSTAEDSPAPFSPHEPAPASAPSAKENPQNDFEFSRTFQGASADCGEPEFAAAAATVAAGDFVHSS